MSSAPEFPQYRTLLTTTTEVMGRYIVHIEFNRPRSKNAMTFDMAQEFHDLTQRLHTTAHLAAVVLSGACGTFCSGGDLSWLADSKNITIAELRHRMRGFYDAFLSISHLPVPTISAVEGAAIGAGMAIAAATDLRVIASDAKVGAPFTHLGLHPGMATTFNLPRLLGDSVANDVLLTGRILTGRECHEYGFSSRCTEPGQAPCEAIAMAGRIAKAAPIATELTTKALRTGHNSVSDALEWESLAQPVTMRTEDAAEGLSAAAQKRRPTFTGN